MTQRNLWRMRPLNNLPSSVSKLSLLRLHQFLHFLGGCPDFEWKKWKNALVAQSCPTLWGPMDCSLLAPLSMGFSRQRILKWVAIPFSRGSSQPRDGTQVSALRADSLLSWATRKACSYFEFLSIPECVLSSYAQFKTQLRSPFLCEYFLTTSKGKLSSSYKLLNIYWFTCKSYANYYIICFNIVTLFYLTNIFFAWFHLSPRSMGNSNSHAMFSILPMTT